jgi:hypothetical protein
MVQVIEITIGEQDSKIMRKTKYFFKSLKIALWGILLLVATQSCGLNRNKISISDVLQPCELPCYMGMRAGVTEWRAIAEKLDEQGIEHSDAYRMAEQKIDVYNVQFHKGYFDTTFWVKDEYIIAIKVGGKKENHIVTDDGYFKNLKEIQTQLGIPDEVYIHSYNRKIQGVLEVSYILDYNSAGVLVFNSNFAELDDGIDTYPIKMCDSVSTEGVIYLYDPSLSLDEVDKIVNLFGEMEYKKIKDISAMDVSAFYSQVQDRSEEFCLSISRDWSQP